MRGKPVEYAFCAKEAPLCGGWCSSSKLISLLVRTSIVRSFQSMMMTEADVIPANFLHEFPAKFRGAIVNWGTVTAISDRATIVLHLTCVGLFLVHSIICKHTMNKATLCRVADRVAQSLPPHEP